jgi:4-amino-4-deoxy-L-arabinose transferase-like glycosyltransferase
LNGQEISYRLKFSNIDNLAIIITVVFLIVVSIIAFVYHDVFFENDGIYFLLQGKQFLEEGPKNIESYDAPITGSILFAFVGDIFNDDFFAIKLISVLSSTGIVFLSYYIIRNLFGSKIAILGQLIFALNPRFDFLSVSALNELLPVLLICIALYFVTKKSFSKIDVVLIGIFLGLSFIFRYQSFIILFGIIIFIIIKNKKIYHNLKNASLLCLVFIIMISPLLIFNIINFDSILTSNSTNYALLSLKFQTEDLHNTMENMVITNSSDSWIFMDFNLFLENYFYNLFYNNSSLLFNLNQDNNNLSIIPFVPLISFLLFSSGVIYLIRPTLTKNIIVFSLGSTVFTAVIIFLFGDFSIHYFALLISPIVPIILVNFKKIDSNLQLIIILPSIFLLVISIVPLYRSYQLLPIMIFIVSIYSYFLIEVIPRILNKFKIGKILNKHKFVTYLIVIILISNFIMSYGLIFFSFQGESFTSIQESIMKIFKSSKTNEILEISEILSTQSNIESSYVMGQDIAFAYYSDSKFVHTKFSEGSHNDTLNSFINRENWSDYDKYLSNSWSIPAINGYEFDPIPDYLIYKPEPVNFKTIWYENPRNEITSILSAPDNVKIPSNFEEIYHSNKTGTIVYKINHEK